MRALLPNLRNDAESKQKMRCNSEKDRNNMERGRDIPDAAHRPCPLIPRMRSGRHSKSREVKYDAIQKRLRGHLALTAAPRAVRIDIGSVVSTSWTLKDGCSNAGTK